MTGAEADAVLRTGDDRAIHQLLRKPPKDIDPALASAKLVEWLDGDRSVWGFARYYKKLPVPVIRALMQRLESRTSPAEMFLRVYLDGAKDLAAAWEAALFRLLSLDTTYAWGSKQKREKLTGLAQEAKVVEALQAAVVANEDVRIDALAVLALDASEASVDALMPHFERAAKDKDRGLDRLQMLKKYASPTPAMTAMLARVDALLDARHAASPALTLAEHLGLGAVKTFWFNVWVGSKAQTAGNVPVFQGSVHVDSRHADWFGCSISELHLGGLRSRYTHFTAMQLYSDTLKLGRCDAKDLPKWFATAAKKLKLTWVWSDTPRASVRGKKRDDVVAWLRSG